MGGFGFRERVGWVDCAKGICIVLVVTAYATLAVETAGDYDGWLHPVVTFANPFLMPLYFVLSGLFVAFAVERPWREYLDAKVARFAYFFALWATILFAMRMPQIVPANSAGDALHLYVAAFVEPIGPLWFIYVLPLCFVAAKLTLRVPIVVIWLSAAALEILHLQTGWRVADAFAAHFVYFYTGFVLAPHLCRVAKKVQRRPWKGLLLVALWAPGHYAVVRLGYAQTPVASLALGLAGAAAMIRLSALLAMARAFTPLRYCGKYALAIYLAFPVPLALARAVLLSTPWAIDVGTMSALAAAAALLGSLCLYWAARGSAARFLFERPQAFRLTELSALAIHTRAPIH